MLGLQIIYILHGNFVVHEVILNALFLASLCFYNVDIIVCCLTLRAQIVM